MKLKFDVTKKCILSLAFSLCVVGITNAQTLTSNKATLVEAKSLVAVSTWKATQVDLGKIEQGKPVTKTFELSNTGEAPLIISNVQTSCGCTASEWPKEPVLPGESAKIKVTYSAASAGVFSKTITVTSNAETPTTVLTIKGEVVGSK